jgi:hypothetical protein
MPAQAPHNARVGLAHRYKMGRALGRLTRHSPFVHLYLCTIIVVLVLVVITSFVILLFFSLPSCLHLRATPFSAEGVGALKVA